MKLSKNVLKYIYIYAVSIVLLLSGVIKILDPSNFNYYLNNIYLLPQWLSIIISTYFPLIEIIIALCLLFNYKRRIFVSIVLYVFIVFVAVHLYKTILLGDNNNCNCFGSLFVVPDFVMLALNVVVVLFTLYIKGHFEVVNLSIKAVIMYCIQHKTKTIIYSTLMIAMLVFWSVVRIDRIQKESNMGLIKMKQSDYVNIRLRQLLVDKYESYGDTSKVKVFLFLRSPECTTCLAELLLWNGLVPNNKYQVFGIYPSTAASGEEVLKKVYKLKIPLLRLDKDRYVEILGKYGGIFARLAIDKSGNVITDNSAKKDNEEEIRQEFISKLENL